MVHGLSLATITGRSLGETPFAQVSTAWALTCPGNGPSVRMITLSYCHTVLQAHYRQWCIAKNGGGYTQRGVAKGLKVPCLFMITEVSIRCPKNPEVGMRRIPAYTPQYTTDYRCIHGGRHPACAREAIRHRTRSINSSSSSSSSGVAMGWAG